MSQDPLFNIDVVRDFIIDKGGKVTNHDLVTHFKLFLNDPARKDANRLKFKEFVNTLATVKLDLSGEKVLVLKRKFRNVESFKSADRTSHITHKPPIKQMARKPKTVPSANPTEDVEPTTSKSTTTFHAPTETNTEEISSIQPSEQEETTGPTTVSSDQTVDLSQEPSTEDTGTLPAPTLRVESPVDEENFNNKPDQPFKDGDSSEQMAGQNEETPPEKPTEAFTDKVTSDTNLETPEITRKLSSAEEKAIVMSVKERAKHINKIESTTDLQRMGAPDSPARNLKGGKENEDTSSVSSGHSTVTMDSVDREWVLASARADYQALAKLLNSRPSLARRKDFITGFTALHWAAKHGNSDIVKLLCGTQTVNINAKTFGGYTPLHLAAMHSHEDVIELLLKTYGADVNIRDHSGKKPKQYLRHSASTRAQPVIESELLTSRRISVPNSSSFSSLVQPSRPSNFKRVGSYSAKIQKASMLSSALQHGRRSSMRSSWSASTNIGESGAWSAETSPHTSPVSSPQTIRKSSLPPDLMQPPKNIPPKKRKSRNKSLHSKHESSIKTDVLRAESDPELSRITQVVSLV